jgi:hypothetical protein
VPTPPDTGPDPGERLGRVVAPSPVPRGVASTRLSRPRPPPRVGCRSFRAPPEASFGAPVGAQKPESVRGPPAGGSAGGWHAVPSRRGPVLHARHQLERGSARRMRRPGPRPPVSVRCVRLKLPGVRCKPRSTEPATYNRNAAPRRESAEKLRYGLGLGRARRLRFVKLHRGVACCGRVAAASGHPTRARRRFLRAGVPPNPRASSLCARAPQPVRHWSEPASSGGARLFSRAPPAALFSTPGFGDPHESSQRFSRRCPPSAARAQPAPQRRPRAHVERLDAEHRDGARPLGPVRR